ncbi:ATP-grasp domain-containing protein [Nocardia panacis]|uniref:ATP-grasp domain-containing protein n=1 Tax=Nocardia panacis TaxID=2340916 RepID=A0A3A4JNY9_9NOCA|nr:ATP-grasp domain-containing protein [Nocardia panacis]RJO70698.1 ATP-grasp domain-containing protein [Nocardia panacis]
MHIVVVNRWPRFSDGARWDNELTRYEEFIDHVANRVSYIVDAGGAAGVLVDPTLIAHLEQIEDVNDVDLLRAAVQRTVDRVGPVDSLIALSEFTLGIAARIREELGIAGPTIDEVARYRDKVRMKQVVAAAGIRAPRFAPCANADAVRDFARRVGYPVVLKPVDGAASIGVHEVDDSAALERVLSAIDLSGYEVEEFVTGVIHHVDGYAGDDSQIAFQVVSRYVNDCLSFATGAPLGSVVLQCSPLRTRIEDFARRCVAVLGLRTTPFHLELFLTPAGDLVFLEIGGRVGGGDVPHLLNKLFGVNLYEMWLRALAGQPITPPVKNGDPSGGWLIVPKPDRTVRVVTAGSMRAELPMIWRELIPAPGEVLAPGGAYDALHSGRFIVLHDNEQVAETGIRKIIDNFCFEAVPL